MTRNKEGLDIFLMFREDPNSHWRVTGGEGKADWEHQNGMMCWTADWSCGCLWPIACACQRDCVCVCARLWLSVGLFWVFLASSCVCLCWRKRTRDCGGCRDALRAECGFTCFHDPKFLLDYQVMLWRENAAAGSVDRWQIVELPTTPRLLHWSWLCVAASSLHFVILSVWHRLKSAEAFSSIRLDWSQLLTSALLTSETKHC